jgi:hypothetical protein
MAGQPSGIRQGPGFPVHDWMTKPPPSADPPPPPFLPPAAAASTRRRTGTTATTNPSLNRMAPPPTRSRAGQPSIQALEVSIDFATSLRSPWTCRPNVRTAASATVIEDARLSPCSDAGSRRSAAVPGGILCKCSRPWSVLRVNVRLGGCAVPPVRWMSRKRKHRHRPLLPLGFRRQRPSPARTSPAYKLHADLTAGDARDDGPVRLLRPRAPVVQRRRSADCKRAAATPRRRSS